MDQALAELDLKYGTDTAATSASRSANAAASSSTLGFRQLLAVYPKNLDADAELRRFFGSKVVCSSPARHAQHKTENSDFCFSRDIEITPSHSIRQTPLHHLQAQTDLPPGYLSRWIGYAGALR